MNAIVAALDSQYTGLAPLRTNHADSIPGYDDAAEGDKIVGVAIAFAFYDLPQAQFPRIAGLPRFNDQRDAAVIALDQRVYGPVNGGGAANVTVCPSRPPPEDNTAEHALLARAVEANLASGRAWLLDLVTCSKVRGLKKKNIRNYFLSAGLKGVGGSWVLKLIESYASFIPVLTDNAEFLTRIRGNKFLSYHTSYSSSAGLMEQFLLPVGSPIVTDATRNAIMASKEAPWDIDLNTALPTAAIQLTFILMAESGSEIDSWYQGRSARDEMPVSVATRMTAFAKKFYQLQSDVTPIERAANMAELAAAMQITV